MIIGVINEKSSFETRVAVMPKSVESFIKSKYEVLIEAGAGEASEVSDKMFQKAGAKIKQNQIDVLRQADILLKVQPPLSNQIKFLKSGAIVIGDFQNLADKQVLADLKNNDNICFALDKLPRISRAQPFDVLSSQNNLAGYQSVIKAVSLAKKAVPMMVTAAGVVAPLKFLIVGIGVAGLQAIATAKRLGAKVYAYDVREEVKEQVKSLNAVFVAKISEVLSEVDVIITSAFTIGKRAPLLLDAKALKKVKKGAIIIDLAAGFGGNVEGVCNFRLKKEGDILIYGNSNLAAELPVTASTLLANNLANFVGYLIKDANKKLRINWADELINDACIVKGK